MHTPIVPGETKVPFMEWNEQYRMHIESLDRQHQAIIALINEVQEAIQSAAAPVVVDSILRKLNAYAEEHFAYEEQCMELCQFASLKKHQCQHQEMKRVIADFQTAIALGNPAIYMDLLNFLMKWLHSHILRVDMEYAKDVRAVGIR